MTVDPERTKIERESVDPFVIKLDPGLQSRDATDERVVDEYAAALRDGATFPAVVLYHDGTEYWCADGWHRVLAARAVDLEEIDADVREGSRRDALRHSLGANTTHGLRRTSADKRRAVTIALADPEWAELSDREIARLCGVSHTFVAQLRRPRVATLPLPEPTLNTLALGELVRAAAQCLDHAHRGSATSEELRAAVERRLATNLTVPEWEAAVERGRLSGMWALSDGLICSHAPRPRTAPPPTDSPIPRPTDVVEEGDPAAQGHQAALEEDGWEECPECEGNPDDDCDLCEGEGGWWPEDGPLNLDSDTDTDAEKLPPSGPASAAPGASESGRVEAPEPAAPTPLPDSAELRGWRAVLAERKPGMYAEHQDEALRLLSILADAPHGRISQDEARSRLAAQLGRTELKLWEFGNVMRRILEVGLAKCLKHGKVPCIELVGRHRPSAMPPDELPVLPPSVSLSAQMADEEDARADLPDDQRAKNDAYYTPDLHARALVRWLSQHVYPGQDPQRILEPSVGGGAWLRACRDEWPEAHLRASDIDADAAGLLLADRGRVGDFMALDLESADLIVGNPPYGDEDLDRAAARARLVAWIDRSRELAPVVGYLMRSTFLGAMDRLEWWQRRPPTDVIVVLPRPAWEGPGKRATTDRVDSLFVVWRGAVAGSTRLHWLDAREGA